MPTPETTIITDDVTASTVVKPIRPTSNAATTTPSSGSAVARAKPIRWALKRAGRSGSHIGTSRLDASVSIGSARKWRVGPRGLSKPGERGVDRIVVDRLVVEAGTHGS